jgi:hypothetical protein
LRNSVVKIIRQAKEKHIYSLIEKCETENQNIWSVLSDIIPTKNNNKKITKPINNDSFNPENLNEFFTTVASDKVKQLISNDSNDSSLKVDVLCDKTFSLPVVNNEMIESRIMKMSSKKSTGIDSISVRFLQLVINYICPSITFLINCCLREGVLPNIWKIAKVVPLFKSGNKNDLNNYRPISILPNVSKVIESIVFDHIHHYLLDNKLLSDRQFGFRKKHSTIDALLGIQKSVLSAVEKKKKVCIVSIDLYKAFDSVNHLLLLLKLIMIGFDLNAIKFLSLIYRIAISRSHTMDRLHGYFVLS